MPGDSSRSLRGRIGAYAMHARNDSYVVTANARAAFMARFDDEVDPNRELPEAERARRAMMARKAYFARLAYASAEARRCGAVGVKLSAGHVIPMRRRPDLALERLNVHASCRSCQNRHQNRSPVR